MGTNKKITAVIFSFNNNIPSRIISKLNEIEVIDKIVIVSTIDIDIDTVSLIKYRYLFAGETIGKIIERTSTPYLLLINGNKYVELTKDAVDNFISQTVKTQAGWIYSDYFEKQKDNSILHPLIDYQIGSIRDDFDLGNCFIVRTDLAKDCLADLYSAKNSLRYSGLYNLRLTISRYSSVVRINKP